MDILIIIIILECGVIFDVVLVIVYGVNYWVFIFLIFV